MTNTLNAYQAQSKYIAQILRHVLVNERGLQAPKGYYLTESDSGNVWLFAVMDEKNFGGNIAPYVSKQLLHQMQTAVNGHPVILSNSTGLRYAVLINSKRKLPNVLDFTGCDYYGIKLGFTARFDELRTDWASMGHVMVAGQTGSGKSNFLRLLALQALSDGHKAIIIDAQDRTFPSFAARKGVIYHARNLQDAPGAIDKAIDLYNQRVDLFKACPGQPDNIDAYNNTQPNQIPRILIFIEEFTGLLRVLGKASDEYKALTRLAWESRKFGFTIIAAGQSWEKNIAGEIREQFVSRFCFKVSTAAQSRIAINKPGAESIQQPGVCMYTMPGSSGKLKTYYLTPGKMDDTKQVSQDEKNLLAAAIEYNQGKVDIEFIKVQLDCSHSQAQKLAAQLEARGWIAKDAARNNARFITDAAKAFTA